MACHSVRLAALAVLGAAAATGGASPRAPRPHTDGPRPSRVADSDVRAHRAGRVPDPAAAVWYSPHFDFMSGTAPPPDFFPLLAHPETAWPELAARTSTFKLKMSALAPAITAAQLAEVSAAVRRESMTVGLEIGGARWGAGRCDAAAQLAFARQEQAVARRWLAAGGALHSVTTDHACTWDIRHELPQPHCDPPVPLAARIDAVAQVLASWRLFLGPAAAIGFIESLGYWDLDGPDGTNYTNVSPETLNNITGWIPRLEDATAALLAAGARHNPTPAVPLIDHYQIDYGMDGVEQDTLAYGPRPPVGMNYNRILGAEDVMRRHGLRTGVILNANAAHMRTYAPTPPGCLVACDPALTLSHSAILRTLNVTRGYVRLPARGSAHVLFEQWQAFPNATGPETAPDTGMWMASHAAAVVLPHSPRRKPAP